MKKFVGLLMVLFLVSGCSFNSKCSVNDGESVNKTFYDASQKIVVNDLLDLVSIGRCGASKLDFSNSNKLTLNDLDDIYKYSMAYHNFRNDVRIIRYDGNYIDSEELSKSYEHIFGVKPSLPDKLQLFFGGFELNNNLYSMVSNGGSCEGFVPSYLLDGYEIDNDSLSFNVIYYVKNMTISKITNENADFVFDLSGNDVSSADLEKVKSNKEKFIQYKFNFKLNNDHYIFDSVEKVN